MIQTFVSLPRLMEQVFGLMIQRFPSVVAAEAGYL